MKPFLILCSFICGMIVLNSCSKKSSSSNNANNKLTLLTSGAWKIDTIGIDVDGNGTIDEALPGGVPACIKDNTITFNADSTGVENEGAIKCDSSSPQTTNFQWSFNSTQTAINFPDSLVGSFGGTATIEVLTSTQLHLEQAVTESGVTVNVAIYLSH
ncbi:MAG TPA: lipocalin family protein [Puia sp.]|nr:lipocalin family protein [Puia sp.]